MTSSQLVDSLIEDFLKARRYNTGIKQKELSDKLINELIFVHKRPIGWSYTAYRQTQKNDKSIVKVLYPAPFQNGSKYHKSERYF